METLFDKILAGEIPATVVHQDDDVFAFKDINPQAPVHVLVIPRKRARGFESLKNATAADAGAFIAGVARVAEKLGLEGNGYRVVFNVGKDGQQTVEYLHAHILGGRKLSWPPG